MEQRPLQLGIDIGSTTAKLVLANGDTVLWQKYERHFSLVREKMACMLRELSAELALPAETPVCCAVSGSAGLGLSNAVGLPFVQEVFATSEIVSVRVPDASAAVELGGEDAKIIFFEGGLDERMNGTCAGGTGAFIDQMATLLDLSVAEMDALSLKHSRLYPIASRCGVFAKTDIQPLLNQGADKADVAASIYQAVVNQTIAGLARGRRIGRGADGAPRKVLFLGGPLHFCRGLQDRFVETLGLERDVTAIFPEWGPYAVALGAARYAGKSVSPVPFSEILRKVESGAGCHDSLNAMEPLFSSEEEYRAFRERHAKADVPRGDPDTYRGDAWLGIDCGSTTTKLVLMGEGNELLYTYYAPNRGDPVEIIREQLTALYDRFGDRIRIRSSAVTGYGEDLIRAAFSVDLGVVETIAHFTAAHFFRPDVDFILDIGGQDIKCFRIRNNAIDSILLNEACSSGCGSFLETFAKSMGCTAEEFARRGLFAAHPVNLGTRCTVFMNSSVKQAQKDGATPEDISAGLCISVVRNAIYKVIRVPSAEQLGRHLVVQGGTFLNDCVLRAFECELGTTAVRPAIAGLMGAYGAALYAREQGGESSGLLSREALASFTHTSSSAVCHGCTNACRLTVNRFDGGRRYISGNRCEKGAGAASSAETLPTLYEWKLNALYSLSGTPGKRGKIGFPMALGMYELAPLWHAVFTALGFEVVLSERSSRSVYELGQFSIPSDTACYPAKLMHGHIESLVREGVPVIFYPCLSYNINEGDSANHYNCPVVAYYSELLRGNMDSLSRCDFFYPYLCIDSERTLADTLLRSFREHGWELTKAEARRAAKAGFAAYRAHIAAVRAEGERILSLAREQGRRIMILAGRPYHVDPEIHHGIDRLAASLGFAVVSEDAVSHLAKTPTLHVLNQWTYHARLYRAAIYASEHPDTELVQLVSFGCGVDAITTDEVCELLESRGKFYTQIKIDEITNLGAVKIRLRSLLGAIEKREKEAQRKGADPSHV